jgi:hypothetical protein
VGPWEWEAHPEWLSRVQTRLVAEDEGRAIKITEAAKAAEEAQETRA